MLDSRAFVFASIMLVGCGSSDGEASKPPATQAASCGDVCTKVTQLCGSTPPDCEGTCGSFSDELKSCVMGAASCQAANACGSSPSADGGSSSTNPCDKCSEDQFCVTSSSVASEIGCYTPPSSCNGSTTSICPCMYTKGAGPCSKGTASCSEGVASTIACN